MIANYFILDDISLKKFENLSYDEKFEKIEDMKDDENILFCDINDIWAGLYYLISNKKEPIYTKENFSEYAKSVFIFGELDLNTPDYIAYTLNKNLKEIIKEIEKIDFFSLKFEPKLFAKNDIFPAQIWENDEYDSLLELLEMAFDELKNFYKTAIKQNKNILVTIN